MKTEREDETSAPIKVRGRGRPARISRQRIARGALEIGIDRVTVTALAEHLGVDHSSLYGHVKSRDEIIAMAAELAIEELDWRGGVATGWRAELIALTDAVWALYARHPGLAEALRALDVMPRSGIRAFAEAVSRLRSHGFPQADAVLAVDMLIDLTGDCALGWRALEQAERRRPAEAGILRIWQDAAAGMPELSEEIEGMVAVMQDGPRAGWERKRTVVLDGLDPARRRR